LSLIYLESIELRISILFSHIFQLICIIFRFTTWSNIFLIGCIVFCIDYNTFCLSCRPFSSPLIRKNTLNFCEVWVKFYLTLLSMPFLCLHILPELSPIDLKRFWWAFSIVIFLYLNMYFVECQAMDQDCWWYFKG